jgi:hypothetical protein
MGRILTQEIPGTECIGDSLQLRINPNFLKLDEAVQTLSSTSVIPSNTSTVGLTLNTTNRQLSASIINSSVTNEKIAFDGGALGFRNFAINGNFDIWQRRTSYTGNVRTPISYPAADRWISYISIPADNNPNGTYTVSRRDSNATELASFNSRYYMRQQLNITSYGNATPSNYSGGMDGPLAIQNIENAANILGKTVTLSFWARASQPTKLLSESQIHSSASAMWTPTINKIIDITTTWQRYTHTYTMPTFQQVFNAAYNPNNVNVANPQYIPLGNNLPPLHTWVWQIDIKSFWSLGSHIRHGNHANRPQFPGEALTIAQLQALNNAADAMKNGGWYDIAQVQIELGNTATAFEHKPMGTELALCQRYYCKTYGQNTTPGTATYDGCVVTHTDEPTSPTIHNIGWSFPVSMRATPSVAVYAPQSGAINNVTRDSSNWPVASIQVNENRISWVNLAQNSPTAYRFWFAQYTADAEL